MAHKTYPEYNHRWQTEAHRALGVMLDHGFKAGLPALTWIVATTGALTGEVGGLTETPAEQRAAVKAWAAYLGATVQERTNRDGVTHLYAGFTWQQDDQVKGAIRATLFPQD